MCPGHVGPLTEGDGTALSKSASQCEHDEVVEGLLLLLLKAAPMIDLEQIPPQSTGLYSLYHLLFPRNSRSNRL